MEPSAREPVLLDTSVLVNFLCLDRVSVLARLPSYSFYITDQVREEIKVPDQWLRLQAALQNGWIQETGVAGTTEAAVFGVLMGKFLGHGECAAIAVAQVRGWIVAVDDKVARKEAQTLDPPPRMTSTPELVVELIRHNLLTVDEADRMKSEWAASHRFCLRIESFSRLLADEP